MAEMKTPPDLSPAGGQLDDTLSFAGYRFPPQVISYAVWLYYRFHLSLPLGLSNTTLTASSMPCTAKTSLARPTPNATIDTDFPFRTNQDGTHTVPFMVA
jgi:hypothetical protein